ncbi:MAG: hypothetical protein ACRCVG_04520 [Methanobacteriaceae archaeon]
MNLNNTTPFNNVSSIQYKLFDFDYNNLFEENNAIKNSLPVSRKLVMVDENFYAYENPFCKHCYSRDVVENNTNERSLYKKDGTLFEATVQRYKCNNCGISSQVEFTGQYDSYCRYSIETKDKSVRTAELDAVSLRNISKLHKVFNNFPISHETVRKAIKVHDCLYFINNHSNLSGYYGYDEQWVKIKGIWKYRYVLFDLVTKTCVTEGLYDNIEKETIKEFIDKSIPLIKRKAIVTDLKTDYESIMDDLGFNHQKCMFHLDLTLKKKIREFLNKETNKIKKEIKKASKKLSKSEIKKIAEEKIEPIKEEILEYKSWFFQLFDFKHYKDALNFIEQIRERLVDFPTVLKDYLSLNFMPIYKRYLTFLKFPNKSRLDRTNNQTENYIGNTMSKADKKKFRTDIGFMSQIYHRTKNWTQTQAKH